MITLADLKRYLNKGATIVQIFNSSSQRNIGKKREVVKVQTNGVYLIDPDGPKAEIYRQKGKGSWLDFPKASLLELTEKGFKIYDQGKRDFTEQEKEIMKNRPEDSEQEKNDILTDGSTMFRRRKRYFKEKGFEYLFRGTKDKRIDSRDRNKIIDSAVKGELILEYSFVL